MHKNRLLQSLEFGIQATKDKIYRQPEVLNAKSTVLQMYTNIVSVNEYNKLHKCGTAKLFGYYIYCISSS